MAEARAPVVHGTLDLLILQALIAGELHGLGVSRRIQQITRGRSRCSLARYSLHFIGWKRPARYRRPGSRPRPGELHKFDGVALTTTRQRWSRRFN